MRSIVRIIGKMLRLIGISSSEDSVPKPGSALDPPSWRASAPPLAKPEEASTEN